MKVRKPIITSIREFLETNPYLVGGQVQIEGFERPMKCSVESESGGTVYKQYLDGSRLRQYPFKIVTADAYDMENRKLIMENGFWQYLEEWLEQQNAEGNYPALEDYMPLRVEVMESGFVYEEGTGHAEYCMQCKLIYE